MGTAGGGVRCMVGSLPITLQTLVKLSFLPSFLWKLIRTQKSPPLPMCVVTKKQINLEGKLIISNLGKYK
jgi:hypothetical protein